MQFGVTLPNVGTAGDPHVLADLAHEAEQAGWDGVFVWDCVYVGGAHDEPNQAACDPWIAMAAMSVATERVRIGPMVTPLSRRRPWKVARETVTLDHLSDGRLILPVGLGATDDGGFANVGEVLDRKARAGMLDEGLQILAGLWSGQAFSLEGEHYQVKEMTFLPTPVQRPRIPIWVVAAWPRMKSMRRAVRWDGVLPAKMEPDNSFSDMTPDDIRALCEFISEHRPDAQRDFDIVIEGETPGDDAAGAAKITLPLQEAGVTWWLESVWASPETAGGLEGMRHRIRQGPPPQ
jgi:alkanesulfonate monooxygenase SsuD/methylene tetrahydromethanopterin reductase-like flavin-dependent oxidoreductase (luciferase family)